MRFNHPIFALLCVLSLIAAACGGRDDAEVEADDTPATTEAPAATDAPVDDEPDDTGSDDAAPATTEAPAADPCEAEEPVETEIGVTADTITVVVMADVENPLQPGLFQGSVDGIDAWAANLNDNGGLACRTVEVMFADSMLNPTETTNGFLTACENALALVGTTVLFALDTADLNGCEDREGNAIGVPDVAYITTEPSHQCSPNSFHISRPGASCPWQAGDGERDYLSQVGPVQWMADTAGEALSGIYLVPSDLPSTTASAFPQIEAQNALAAGTIAEAFAAPGAATQAEYGDVAQAIRENGYNYVYNGSSDQVFLKAKAEAAAQGLDTDSINWLCSSSCYTPEFIDIGGENAEGTYVWMNFLPFHEAEFNEELATFMDAVDDSFPAAWAAGSWAGGVLLEQVINDIVDSDGINGITRASVLDGLRATADFSANGWWGEVSFESSLTMGGCWMMMQVQDGEYVRLFPEEPGTLECSDPVASTGDGSAFAPK